MERVPGLSSSDPGIHILSDDILSQVFEGLDDPPFDLVKVSGVSRRFRQLSLDLPRSWSNVSTLWALGLVRACVERSQTQSLSVVISIRLRGGLAEYFDALLPTCSRWKSLTLIFGYDVGPVSSMPYITDQELRIAYQRMFSLRLLRLEVFKVTDSGCATAGENFPGSTTDEDNPFLSTWSSWHTPCLRDISLVEALPPQSAMVPSVTSFTLDTGLPLQDHNIRSLGTLLMASSIKTFSLELPNGEVFPTAPPSFELPSIEEFTFIFEGLDWDDITEYVTDVTKFLKALFMPNLVKFCLKANFTVDDGQEIGESMDLVFNDWIPDPVQHPHLTNLDLTTSVSVYDFHERVEYTPGIPWPLPLDLITKFQAVSISTTLQPGFVLRGGIQHPPCLKHLTLRGCPNIFLDDIMSLSSNLRETAALDTIDTITISKCRRLENIYMVLEAFIPKEKLVIK